jgi:hypothetical protein
VGNFKPRGLSSEFFSAISKENEQTGTSYNIHIENSVLQWKITFVQHRGGIIRMATKLLKLHTKSCNCTHSIAT